jgi:hypothetical protein
LNLKLNTIDARGSLKARVPLNTDFLVEGDLSADLAPLLEDTRVVGGNSSKFAEHDECFYTMVYEVSVCLTCNSPSGIRTIVATFTSKPTRRKMQKQNANAEDETGYHLEEKRQPPRPFTGHESGAISRPEGDHDTDDDAELLKYKKRTTDLWRRDLGYVERSNCS